MKIKYVMDKETKGTYRFAPEDDTIIGNATLYIPKPVVKAAGIDPAKGFIVEIKPV